MYMYFYADWLCGLAVIIVYELLCRGCPREEEFAPALLCCTLKSTLGIFIIYMYIFRVYI